MTELSWSICYGPLIWYACTGGAVLHCAACGHITVTGNWNEPEHMYAEILREGGRMIGEPIKQPDESQTAYTLRIIRWDAWDEGHRAGCVYFPDCIRLGHHEPNPYGSEQPEEEPLAEPPVDEIIAGSAGITAPHCASWGCDRGGFVKSERWGAYLCPEHALNGPVKQPTS